MVNSRKFTAIAARSMLLTRSDGFEMPIYVAIGAPSRVVREDGSVTAACFVATCDDPDLATEISGDDEMDALAVGLEFLELYLIKIVEETGGKLSTMEGKPVESLGSILLKSFRLLLANKLAP